MKNLEVLELVNQPLRNTFSQAQFFSQTNDSIYFISNQTLHKINLSENSTVELCPIAFENVICVKVLTIEGKICVVTTQQFYIIDPEGLDEIKTIDFSDEIAQISWNPTEELVVTVAQSGQVTTFNVDYENGEVFLQESSTLDARVPDTVYVGWGSKETQFRGSEGKLKPTEPTVEEKPVEEQTPYISWRGNGEMFVINYWTQQKRKFLVFETPCKALYQSEECLGLQCPIAWRPVGNMIATLTELSDKQSIVIFEKNGQKRFNIDLKFDQEKIKGIKWSPCANILTLYSETPHSQCLHLFTSSNYKWYEKQRLVFSPDNPLRDFTWFESPQSTYMLRVVTKNEIITYTFHSVVNSSDLGTCAVINGNNLQLTDFQHAVIPPSLCARRITNDKSILSVVLNDQYVVIVDCANLMKIFDIDNLGSMLHVVDLAELVCNVSKIPLAFHHFVMRDEEIYFAAESKDEKICFCFNVETKKSEIVGTTEKTLRHLIILNTIGRTVNLRHIGDCLYMNSATLPTTIRQIVGIVGAKAYNCQLTSNCCFYINDEKYADSVNSFIIFDEYLLYTTKLNELHCLKLSENLEKTYRRNVEQGANIIAAIANSPKIVLQMPRGNLETISCRLISIDILDRLLSQEKWREAIRFIRLEKLNANLLFDLNPDRFLKQIDRFIKSIKTVNVLNAICLDFEEDNVLATLYQKKAEKYPGKIAAIFGEMFKYFDRKDYAPYITTVVIINLRFFTLKDALIYLQDLLKRDMKKSLVEAVNTLKTYGCDQDKLYLESLLLYDLDLARFIASCCQLDPRVYEPQLNNLKNLGEVRRRYEINVFGKNPKVAITYLLRCPEVTSTEILNFIKTHKVSKEAYASCPPKSVHYKAVSKAFAEELTKNRRHEEAAAVFKRAGLLQEAMESFKMAFRWREVLDLAKELGIGEMEKMIALGHIARHLNCGKTASEAAILYEHYCNNYEMAISTYVVNNKWMEALHVAKKYGRKDIIISDIIPAVMTSKSWSEKKYGWLERDFVQYKARLVKVREMKLAKFTHGQDNDKSDELFSDADSLVSRSSRRSSRSHSSTSSKKRRRDQAKKMDLREGGVYEDIALVRTLYMTVDDIYRMGESVRQCCMALLEEGEVSFKELKTFYQNWKKLCNKVQDELDEIWLPHFNAQCQMQTPKELADLENFEHLDLKYRTPPDPSELKKHELTIFED